MSPLTRPLRSLHSTVSRTRLNFSTRMARTASISFLRSTTASAPTLASSLTTASANTTLQVRSFSSARQGLSDILAREHGEELENKLTEMPEELATLKTDLEKHWKIVDDGAMTRMHRTIGTIKAQVTFHCQDTVLITDDFLQEEQDEVAAPVKFTVTATKTGKTLVLTCISEDAAARIQTVAVTTEDVESIQGNGGIDGSHYQGPDFSELAEDLQEAFHVYIDEEVGVNEDMAAFIAMYTDYKEETHYVQFLDDAKSLLE